MSIISLRHPFKKKDRATSKIPHKICNDKNQNNFLTASEKMSGNCRSEKRNTGMIPALLQERCKITKPD